MSANDLCVIQSRFTLPRQCQSTGSWKYRVEEKRYRSRNWRTIPGGGGWISDGRVKVRVGLGWDEGLLEQRRWEENAKLPCSLQFHQLPLFVLFFPPHVGNDGENQPSCCCGTTSKQPWAAEESFVSPYRFTMLTKSLCPTGTTSLFACALVHSLVLVACNCVCFVFKEYWT